MSHVYRYKYNHLGSMEDHLLESEHELHIGDTLNFGKEEDGRKFMFRIMAKISTVENNYINTVPQLKLSKVL